MSRIQKIFLVTPPYHCGMIESAGAWSRPLDLQDYMFDLSARVGDNG